MLRRFLVGAIFVAAACGDDEHFETATPIDLSGDAGKSDGPTCIDQCQGEGPACDSNNQLGRCEVDASGCRVVVEAKACPSESSVCISGARSCVMAGYVVAPGGSDANPGTLDKPFATIAHARDVVRTKNAAMTGDIAVYLRKGDYTLATSNCNYGVGTRASPAGLCLDERDSGSGGFVVRYTSYDEIGSARLLGATRITGWVAQANGSYRAATGSTFDDLYENGVRAVKARTPNINADYGVKTTAQGPYFETGAPPSPLTTTQFTYAPSDVPTAVWTGTVQAQIFSGGNTTGTDTPNYNWSNDLDEVVSVDAAAHVITLRQATSYNIPVGSRYYLQGDLSLLDTAGEFDVEGGYVYYRPRATPIEAQEILAPQVKAIVQVCPRFQEGETALPTQTGLCGHTAVVHDIAIDGLAFEATEFTSEYPDRTEGTSDPSAMVYLENTKNITVQRCRMRGAGQNAIALLYANDDATIADNWIRDVGLSGIYVRTLRTYTGQPASGHHLVRSNKVEFVGMHQTGQLGIHIEESSANTIRNNAISHGPRGLLGGAIDVPAPALGNYFGYNDLFSGAEDSADIAPFYFFGVCASTPCSTDDQSTDKMPPKTIEQLRIDTAAWHSSSKLVYPRSFPPWGFYLDNGSSNWTLKDIYLTNVEPEPINGGTHLYNGGVRITEDNLSWNDPFDAASIDTDAIGPEADFPYDTRDITWHNDDWHACTYTGSWTYRHDASVKDDFGGDEHFTNTAGDSVVCAFTSTEIRILTSSFSNRGVADLSIDGTTPVTVDFARLTPRTQNVIYRKSNLPAGAHTVKLTLRGNRDPASSYLVIDALATR